MARIMGGIGTSHSPIIGFAKDTKRQNDPAWAPMFENYKPIKKWLKEQKPDVLLTIYNDHISSFFFDHYSAFSLGVDDLYTPADEGGGVRAVPPVRGDARLSRHIGASLMADEFDMSFFQKRSLDHGIFSPLSVMVDEGEEWPWAVVPLQVGVLQFPIPSAKRCYALGQALRRAIESYDEDISVAVVATGGLSHQVHGERCGFNNLEWDRKFLELLEHDPVKLTEMTIAEYASLGGVEGAEVIMWLIMRGALSSTVKVPHKATCLMTMTDLATAIFEHQPEPFSRREVEDHLAHVNKQLKGVERLEGTYPYTLERSHKAFRVNKFLHDLVHPDFRKKFLDDPDATLEASDLNAEEKDLVRRRDWRGLIHYGATFFVLEKYAALVGVSNPDVYAGMRGVSLEEFLATRRVQLKYSVGGENRIDKRE